MRKSIKKLIPLAVSVALTPYAFANDFEVSDLGTLKTDQSGTSIAHSVSADGSTIVGLSNNDNTIYRAFKYTATDGLIDLGTLKTDHSGMAIAHAISANGSVIVGLAEGDNNQFRAFKYTDSTKMVDLGTLRTDKLGVSMAYAISADGSVIVGEASNNDNYTSHAFKYKESNGVGIMEDLGSLRSDDSGTSSAKGVSADGSTVVGEAQYNASSTSHAFKHTDATGMVDLGTLAPDHSGSSAANAVSGNGEIVVGQAMNINREFRAFKHTDATGMIDLGTFKTDLSGDSWAQDISIDGRIIVGSAINDHDEERAFKYTDSEGMIDLGTLKADNSGESSASTISADGSVIVGAAQTDNDEMHAIVWKFKQASVDPNNPEPPTEIIKVDATNSNKTMTQAAKDAYKVLDLYRSRLMGLSKAECSLDNFSYCVGAFTNYDSLKSNHAWTTGLFGAIRLAPQWSMGLSVDYLVDSSLPDGYGTRGSSNPGVGAFVHFQQHADKTGFNVTASGAYQEQKIDIRRQKLSNTEAGVGNTKVNGQLLDLDVSYGLKASNKVTLFPHTGIRYTKINRDAYHEYKDTELPAYYGDLGEKSTAITLGLATEYYLSDKITVNADAGMRFNLDQNRNAFTGHIDYIGAHVYDFGVQRKNQPFVGMGIKGLVTKQSAANLQLGWTKQSYDHNTASVGLSYAYRF